MLNVLISGICGKMGEHLINCAKTNPEITISAGFDVKDTTVGGIPVYSDFADVKEKVDAIIDFSRPSSLDALASYAGKNSIPVVLATTGYSEEQKKQIAALSEKIPVFYSANMSLGVSVIKSLVKKAAEILGDDFDIEIIEKHHNMKADAPSGTALALADSINEVFDNNKPYQYGRTPSDGKRRNEIGIHGVRGGTVVGEHEVGFYGDDEIITVSHSARSRKIFANGALKAALYIADKPAGMYNMEMMV